MCKGYFTATFLMIFTNVLCFMDNRKCNYICGTDGCNTFIKKPYDNLPSRKYCKDEDLPVDVNFTLTRERNDIYEFPTKLQIYFKPPQRMCRYEVILLANGSISEEQCMNYIFNRSDVSKIHTRNIICFFSTGNQYQDIAEISFPYIFTACYSIIFYNDNQIKSKNLFLRTDYVRTEIIKPAVKCSYNIISDNISELLNYEVSFSTPIVEDIIVHLGLLYGSEASATCNIMDEGLKDKYKISHILEELAENMHYNFSTNLIVNGKYEANEKFQTREIIQNVDYCFKIFYNDIRCRENTLWNPPVKECTWFQTCRNKTNYNHFKFQFNNNTDIYSSVILLIIIIALFAIVGITYFIYIIYICNIREKKYKGIFDTDTISRDIVLLYPRGCETFMELMADFRKMLCKVSGCAVHDWYDGVEWNNVAAIGGSEWFAEMLRRKYHIIWIDTPTVRSLITQKFKINSFTNNSEKRNSMEIGDFRDVVFPTIFNLAKRDVEQSTLCDSRHFIVRLKGFDHFKSETDPFAALSPCTCYFLPQDLKSLCSDLSISKSDKVVLTIKEEKERIEQHLCNIKSDVCK